MTETNPQFENFTAFMDKLAQVPNSEVKAALEAEKQAKGKTIQEERGAGESQK